ncbi:tas [Squirrel monkey simian foamy virus]|uniref:Tas n=1 Tax=Squirrel monkey simian foamy virus TaxID=2170201 RepID=D5JWU8_9RETR|nr:tas [Squirrel monkey simian foamy virus]ADE05997.1 tas [Squirrel monkey simian foamy virus]
MASYKTQGSVKDDLVSFLQEFPLEDLDDIPTPAPCGMFEEYFPPTPMDPVAMGSEYNVAPLAELPDQLLSVTFPASPASTESSSEAGAQDYTGEGTAAGEAPPEAGPSRSNSQPGGTPFFWLQEARKRSDYDCWGLNYFFPKPGQREFYIQRSILTTAGYRPDLLRYSAAGGWYPIILPHEGVLGNTFQVYYLCLKCGDEVWDPLLYLWDQDLLAFYRAWETTPHTSSPLSVLRRHDASCRYLHHNAYNYSERPNIRKPRRDPGLRWCTGKRRLLRDSCEELVHPGTLPNPTQWTQLTPSHMHPLAALSELLQPELQTSPSSPLEGTKKRKLAE